MEMTDVDLKAGGQQVHGRLYRPESGAQQVAVLFLHGWTGRPNDNAAQVLVAQGFPCFTLIFRGHPGSDGDITTVTAEDSLQDAIAAYDYMKQQLGEQVRIVAVGNSYGGYVAALLSGERELAGLSLRVPATYPDELYGEAKWGKGHDDPAVDAWRHQATPYADNKAFQLMHDFEGPIQIIEAELDDVVPHEAVQNYVAAVNDAGKLSYHLMQGWPHSLGDHAARNQEFQKILLEWVKNL